MATATITDRWTAVPKTRDLIGAGVPAAAIPTYNALADHANNTTGECWPMMETLARILGRTAKTIQRHLRILEEAGLVEVLERRRDGKGRFLGFRFRLPHLAQAATRIRERRERNRAAYEAKKKERREANDARRQRRAEGRPGGRSGGEASSGHSPEEARQERAQERRRGYEWLFDGDPEPKPSQAVTEAPDTPSSPMSAGHESPLGPNKGQTNSGISSPPTPPRGAEDRRSIEEDLATTEDEPAGEAAPHELPADVEAQSRGSEGVVGDPPPGHAAWSRVVYAAAGIREDLDPGEFSITSARLEGSTLSVELRDAPIVEWSGLRRREMGRLADRTRRRYGEDLRKLWREISGDPEAVLELGGGTER
ncbi:MAG: helix-turn-helix domain-containing protein [Actinomycetota bacterium]|nr:helix-turn-helix domain-containing protein [Actinomycetota bacterium]